MFLALGAAASTALDLLSSLQPAKSSATTTTGVRPSKSLFDVSASGTASSSPAAPVAGKTGGNLSPATFSALLAAQDPTQASTNASPSDALKDLFGQIDGNGDGQITKSEFEDKLGAGGTNVAAADDVFSKLDSNADGSVSLDELSSALKGKGGGHHAHHAGGGGGGADALMQALQAASSTSTSNSDGSTTTTMTYADGSKVTLTTPATAAASSGATKSYNLVEQMIDKQSQALSTAAKQSVSINV